MNGSNIVADTSLLVNFFNGVEPARKVLSNSKIWVSVITEMELLSYPPLSKKDATLLRSFLDECIITELTKPIRDITVHVRKNHKLKLPDAIIAATAIHLEFPVVTMDSDFNKIKELNAIILESGN
jgi:predicted nucleic acid-binding protein